jgi:NAD(P)-dependent dehydrogenase (short-subunit alcohol dehydrogenase family)
MSHIGASKTANVLFTVGFNDRVYSKHGVLSISLNPGEIRTELNRYSEQQFQDIVSRMETDFGLVFKSLQQGASTTLVAATDPKLGLPDSNGLGAFLSDCQIAETPAYAVGKEEAQKLWEITEGWVGEKFTW